MQPGASDRVADNERRRLIADVEKAGVATDGARWLDTACTAVQRHLAEHGHANSAELRAALPELAGTFDPAPGRRWGGATPLAPRVLTTLSVRGDIIRGPNEGSWTTSRPRWVHTGTWLGSDVEVMEAAVARAELLRIWLRAFGPATLTDIKWWFGSTLTAVRQALSAIDAAVVDLDGAPGYALLDDLDEVPAPEPWAALLPGLDITTMGWSDATGTSVSTARTCSTPTATRVRRRGGTGGWSAAGIRPPMAGCSCSYWRILVGTPEKR